MSKERNHIKQNKIISIIVLLAMIVTLIPSVTIVKSAGIEELVVLDEGTNEDLAIGYGGDENANKEGNKVAQESSDKEADKGINKDTDKNSNENIEVSPAVTTKQNARQLFALNPLLNADKAFLAEFYVEGIVDGVAPFDTSNILSDPDYKDRVGNDENASNNKVRSFDAIGYDLHYRTQVYDENDLFVEGAIEFEFLLPYTKEQAEWDIVTMAWMQNQSVSVEERTFDFDGDGDIEADETNRSCQVLRGSLTIAPSPGNDTAIPGSGNLDAMVNVLAMQNGSIIRPVFTAWMAHNQAGSQVFQNQEGSHITGNTTECANHLAKVNVGRDNWPGIEQKTAIPKPIAVTAQPRYNVQIKSVEGGARDIYDFTTGNEYALDRDAGTVNGKVEIFGITLQLYNNPDRQLKGIEMPSGPITFDLKLSTYFQPTQGSLSLSQQEAVPLDYAPLVLSFGSHGSTDVQSDERNIKYNMTYAQGGAPANSYGVGGDSANSCYSGGTWRAVRNIGANSNVISVTVDNYEIDPKRFPGSDMGTANAAYYAQGATVQNVGCFSAGEIFLLTPFYSNGTSGQSKKGDYVLDDLGVNGNFHTKIANVNLQAQSVSEQKLTVVNDTSNQMNQSDDEAEVTVYLARGGTIDWRVQWTSLTNFANDDYFRDVLGRARNSQGHWVEDGYDTLTPGSDVGLGIGVISNENGYPENRIVAANLINKFDADVVTLTENTREHNLMANSGLQYEVLYGARPSGSNWDTDDQMEYAKIADLRYYKSLADMEEEQPGAKCVAVLVEVRPLTTADKVQKYSTGNRVMLEIGAKVNEELSLIGNVYQIVIGGEVWHASGYMTGPGKTELVIPTRLNNDPEHPETVPNPGNNPSLKFDVNYREVYRKYDKVQYNAAGSASGHSGKMNFGDSLRIAQSMPTIVKRVAQQEADRDKQTYAMDLGQRYVDFALIPSLSELPATLESTTTLVIEDTLPPNLTYLENSAYLGGEYVQAPESGRAGSVSGGQLAEPTITYPNIKGVIHQRLTWKIEDVSTNDSIPAIYFTATIGHEGDGANDVKNNDELLNSVTITSDDDMRPLAITTGNMATAGIKVTKLRATSLVKSAEVPRYDVGDEMRYRLTVGNNATNPMNNELILDTLPYNQDAKGSSFTGPLLINEIIVDTNSLATVTNFDSWKCFYTTDVAAVDTTAKDHNAQEILNSTATIEWQEAQIESVAGGDYRITGIQAKQDITAVVFIGNLLSAQVFRATVDISAAEAKVRDVFVNNLSRGSEDSRARVTIVEREASGMPWYDADQDGQRSGLKEVPINGVTVTLLKDNGAGGYEEVKDKEGNPVSLETDDEERKTIFKVITTNNRGKPIEIEITAIANADGTYCFKGLPVGTFGIRFEDGVTTLAKYVASPVNVGTPESDSDGVPTIEDGKLKKTEIHEMIMPMAINCSDNIYKSEFNDSGFYERFGSITIIKKDSSGELLAGIEFCLEFIDAQNEWQKVVASSDITDDAGRLTYDELPMGEYRITELTSSEGHSLLAEPLLIKIPYERDVGEEGLSEPAYQENGKNYYLDLTFTVQNTQMVAPPTTGKPGDMVYSICGMVLIVIAILGRKLGRRVTN